LVDKRKKKEEEISILRARLTWGVREASAWFVLSACGAAWKRSRCRWGFFTLPSEAGELADSLPKLGVFALKLVDFGVKFPAQSGQWADLIGERVGKEQ